MQCFHFLNGLLVCIILLEVFYVYFLASCDSVIVSQHAHYQDHETGAA